MTQKLIKPALLFLILLSAALVKPAPSQADVRYCCTPQQISACTAQGGTASCRTSNICQCLF